MLTVNRPRSGALSANVTVPSGPSTMWSIPAATRSPLFFVRWMRLTLRPLDECCSGTSGARSAAAARGSPALGRHGLVGDELGLNADPRRASTGSTSYRIAAIERWANDTSRVERTQNALAGG